MAANKTMFNEAMASPITGQTPTVGPATGPMMRMVDADAAQAFRLAAVKLGSTSRESDLGREASREAGDALAVLARADDEQLLREFLRPDPLVGGVTWSVACYQIGDLTPNALKDFSNPVSAINTLASCPNKSHVAAELVASTPAGMRWTAMTRTGSLVGFQLPDMGSASHASREHPGELTTAIQHWTDQLGRWAGDPADEPMTALNFGPAPQWQAEPQRVAGAQPGDMIPADDVDEVLEMVVTALLSVERRDQRERKANEELLGRLDDISRRMNEFQASVEAEVGRRIHALATYVSEVAGAFAAQQASSSERLEARLDQIAALIPAAGRRSGPFELPAASTELVDPLTATA